MQVPGMSVRAAGLCEAVEGLKLKKIVCPQTYPHPESYLVGSSNRVNLTEYTRFGLLSLIEIPPKLKIHPETR